MPLANLISYDDPTDFTRPMAKAMQLEHAGSRVPKPTTTAAKADAKNPTKGKGD